VTSGEPASARLTVETETPARRAMSAIVGRSSAAAAGCLLCFTMVRDSLARRLARGAALRQSLTECTIDCNLGQTEIGQRAGADEAPEIGTRKTTDEEDTRMQAELRSVAAKLSLRASAGCARSRRTASTPRVRPISRSGRCGSTRRAVGRLRGIIEAFQRENPTIRITHEPVSGNLVYPKFMTAIRGQTMPDIAEAYSYHPLQFAAVNQMEPMDDIIAEWQANGQLANIFNEFAYRKFFWHDHYWGVPYNLDIRAIYYRKDLLEAKGIQPPTNWTSSRRR